MNCSCRGPFCLNHHDVDAELRTGRHEWEITPAHVAGLVVGEGCFYAESRKDPKYLSGWRIRPAFCLEMRADDRAALDIVRAQLDCGRVYKLDFGRYGGYEDRGWKPHAKVPRDQAFRSAWQSRTVLLATQAVWQEAGSL